MMVGEAGRVWQGTGSRVWRGGTCAVMLDYLVTTAIQYVISVPSSTGSTSSTTSVFVRDQCHLSSYIRLEWTVAAAGFLCDQQSTAKPCSVLLSRWGTLPMEELALGFEPTTPNSLAPPQTTTLRGPAPALLGCGPVGINRPSEDSTAVEHRHTNACD